MPSTEVLDGDEKGLEAKLLLFIQDIYCFICVVLVLPFRPMRSDSDREVSLVHQMKEHRG